MVLSTDAIKQQLASRAAASASGVRSAMGGAPPPGGPQGIFNFNGEPVVSLEFPSESVSIAEGVATVGMSTTRVVDSVAASPVTYASDTPVVTPPSEGTAVTLPAMAGRVNFEVTIAPTGATGAGYVWYADGSNYCAISSTGSVSVASAGETVTSHGLLTWTAGQSISVRVTFGASRDTIIEARVASGDWLLIGVSAPIPSPGSALAATYLGRAIACTLNSYAVSNSRATPLFYTEPLPTDLKFTTNGNRFSQCCWDIAVSSSRVVALASSDTTADYLQCGIRVNEAPVSETPQVVGPTLTNVTGLIDGDVVRFTDGARICYGSGNPSANAVTGSILGVYSDDIVELRRNAEADKGVYLLGDSIIAGVGASDVTRYSMTSLIRYSGNDDLIINGIGGYYASYANAAKLVHAEDIARALKKYRRQQVVISLGTNDWAAQASAANYKTWLKAVCVQINQYRPDLQILLVSPLPRTGEDTPNAGGATLSHYRDACAEIALELPSYVHHYAGSLLTGTRADGVHPDDAGYATNAPLLAAAIANTQFESWFLAQVTSIFGASIIDQWIYPTSSAGTVSGWTGQNGKILANIETGRYSIAFGGAYSRPAICPLNKGNVAAGLRCADVGAPVLSQISVCRIPTWPNASYFNILHGTGAADSATHKTLFAQGSSVLSCTGSSAIYIDNVLTTTPPTAGSLAVIQTDIAGNTDQSSQIGYLSGATFAWREHLYYRCDLSAIPTSGQRAQLQALKSYFA